MPTNLDNLKLSSTQKKIFAIFKRVFDDEYDCLINVYPVKDSKIDFALIHPVKGLVLLEIDEFCGSNFKDYLDVIRLFWEERMGILFRKILRNSLLKRGNKPLFPINWVYFFPTISTYSAKSISSEIFVGNTLTNIGWMREHKHSLFLESQLDIKLSTAQLNGIIHLLAPQYVIIRIAPPNDENSDDIAILSDVKLTGEEAFVRYFRLDQEQINIVNNLTIGDQLMLACAGSGKSVMLISKAFKTASEYPDKQILLTCFNRNLATYYDWQIDCAGLRSHNLKCFTFFALLQHLLDINGIPYERPNDDEPDSWDRLFQKAVYELNSGHIKQRFYAIFIDEVQIYKRKWYEFCFNLLESKKKQKHVFVIAGDKSQKVNDNIARGEAPWQVSKPGFPEFEDNTIRIELNYRNCKQINNYINQYVNICTGYFERYKIIYDEDLFLRGQSFRDGYEPEVIISDRYREAKKVVEIILKLKKEFKVSYSDIAIIYPFRHYNPERFYIQHWLEDQLNEKEIEFSFLGGGEGVRFGERRGVNMLTLESALGLDFEAVILCGLLPMGKYNKMTRYKDFETTNDNELESKKEVFFKLVNQLYMACTRARNHLYIILDESPDKNIYSGILWEAKEVSQ